MKAKCIVDNEYGITKNKNYIIFGGKYFENEGIKEIKKLHIQNDNGGFAEYSDKYFEISNDNINEYVFNTNSGEFAFNSIAYPEFLSMLYEDRKEFVSDYLKAKKDLKEAKYCLYSEYSYKDLEERILDENADDEIDFIFSYLKERKDDRFLDIAIDFIKNAIKNNRKAYDVICIFEYLAIFKYESVNEFFVEYMTDDYWGDAEINGIVYNYKW